MVPSPTPVLPSFGDSIIVKEPGAARQALAVLSLTEEIIESIADAAATAKADTMAVEPLNAPGTNAYNKGVAAKRIALLPRGWRMSHDRGIEATVNDDLGIQLVFQNVDAACLERDPQVLNSV